MSGHVDPLEGLDWDALSILHAQSDRPELAVLKGDYYLVEKADAGEAGDLVVHVVSEEAVVDRFPCDGPVIGRVMAVVRRTDG